MRRVYDDTHYVRIAKELENAFCNLNAEEVSEYSYGTYRAMVSKVKEKLLQKVPNIKYGRVEHANGIGNNNAIEIVYVGDPNEEQICGLLHLTDDMYGGVIFWVSDIDNNRGITSWTILGCDRKSEYDIKYKRHARRGK